MADMVTYRLVGLRPKAKTTLTVTADKLTSDFTLMTRTHTDAGDVITTLHPSGNQWTVTLEEKDCIVQVTGPDDVDWKGLSMAVDDDTIFVSREGEKSAIWCAREVGRGDPKNPWPPPGPTPANLDTTWLALQLDKTARDMLVPKSA